MKLLSLQMPIVRLNLVDWISQYSENSDLRNVPAQVKRDVWVTDVEGGNFARGRVRCSFRKDTFVLREIAIRELLLPKKVRLLDVGYENFGMRPQNVR
jgi:hypothetical protein